MQKKLKDLYIAAENGKYKKVEAFIQDGVDINGIYSKSAGSALHIACKRAQLKVVKVLLTAKDLNINLPDEFHDSQTALIYACNIRYTEMVKLLLQYPTLDVNAQTIYGESALHVATRHGSNKIIGMLLTNKTTNLNIQDCNRRTCLFVLVYNFNLETMNILIKPGLTDCNIQDVDGMTVLHLACLTKNIALILRLILTEGIRVDLLDKYGNTALDYAENHREIDSIIANENIIHALLRVEGLNLDHQYKPYNSTLLHWCTKKGHLTALKQLLIRKVNLNLIDIYGLTPLQLACANGHDSLIEPLIDAGATVFIKDKKCQFGIGYAGKLYFFESKNDQFPGEMVAIERKDLDLVTLRELTNLLKFCKVDTVLATQSLQFALQSNEKLTTTIICRLLRHEEGVELEDEELIGILKAVVLSQIGTDCTQAMFCELVAIEYFGIAALYSRTNRMEVRTTDFENYLNKKISPVIADKLHYLIIALLCVSDSDIQFDKLLAMALFSLFRSGKDAPNITLDEALNMLDTIEKHMVLENILSIFGEDERIEMLKAKLLAWLDIVLDQGSSYTYL